MNRLKLNFELNTYNDRLKFVQDLLESDDFKKKKPTKTELETISNYILWGKEENGKSLADNNNIEIETRHKTWARKDIESLDALLESPTFQEGSFRKKSLPLLIRKEKFSREAALKEAPEDLKNEFLNLFKEIDETDFLIEVSKFLKEGKEVRSDLSVRLSDAQKEILKERAKSLRPYDILKLRHQLVALRRQQYTLRDFYRPQVQSTYGTYDELSPEETFYFDTDINVFPLGVKENFGVAAQIFRPLRSINPKVFSEDDLKKISTYLWDHKDAERNEGFYFDFSNISHLIELFRLFQEFDLDRSTLDNNTKNFIDTFYYYIQETNFNEAQKKILELKLEKKPNQFIASTINKTFGTSYSADYISDIYRKQILKGISETAQYHLRLIEKVFFEEEFKPCRVCGDLLLLDERNFIKGARYKDGFTNRCKVCDKEYRDRQKKLIKKEATL